MRGVKIGIVGICVSLMGLSIATNNVAAIGGAVMGFILSLIACFVKGD